MGHSVCLCMVLACLRGTSHNLYVVFACLRSDSQAFLNDIRMFVGHFVCIFIWCWNVWGALCMHVDMVFPGLDTTRHYPATWKPFKTILWQVIHVNHKGRDPADPGWPPDTTPHRPTPPDTKPTPPDTTQLPANCCKTALWQLIRVNCGWTCRPWPTTRHNHFAYIFTWYSHVCATLCVYFHVVFVCEWDLYLHFCLAFTCLWGTLYRFSCGIRMSVATAHASKHSYVRCGNPPYRISALSCEVPQSVV